MLFEWDRFSPKNGAQRSIIWFYDKSDFLEMEQDESLTILNTFTNKPGFSAPANGKVALRWFVLGETINTPDSLLRVTSGGKCLTNGSGIADPNDDLANQLPDVDTVDVPPASVLSLAGTCDGPAIGETVIVPAKGRALLFAYLDGAGKPVLRMLPVADAA